MVQHDRPTTRRDGWTADRRRRFVANIAAGCDARRAAALVGMAREGAYRLRRRDAAFAAAWDEARRSARLAAQTAFLAHLPEHLRRMLERPEDARGTMAAPSTGCDIAGPGKLSQDRVPPVPTV